MNTRPVWHAASYLRFNVIFVKTLKQIVFMGILAAAGTLGSRAGENSGPGSLNSGSQLHVAVLLFQDQKAEYLAQKRGCAKKLRDQAREQVTVEKVDWKTIRHDEHQALQEAKSQAKEQARKFAEESSDSARDARRRD